VVPADIQMPEAHVMSFARAVHVLGVVLWIGGVGFIATVLLPALRRLPDARDGLVLFSAVEGRFKRQARIVTLITGLSGFLMLTVLHAWDRYLHPAFWWIHLMTFIWLVFTLILFVVEPYLINRQVQDSARRNPGRTLRLAHRLLSVLLTLSLIAIFGAVSAVHAS